MADCETKARQYPAYFSIENSYNGRHVDAIRAQGFGGKNEWVVQEKVHGANIRIILTAGATLTGSKNHIVSDGADCKTNRFASSQTLVYETYFGRFRKLFDAQAALGAETVTVYGEIYGGAYPHVAVPRDPTAKTIQGGGLVFYCPHNDLYAFDVRVDAALLPLDEVNALFVEHGIPRAKTLFRGTLAECLAHPNEFPPTIHPGLPAIPGNVCEGVVIRPALPGRLKRKNGTAWAILKNKNAKFCESHQRKKPPRATGTKAAYTAQFAPVAAALVAAVTVERLCTVLTHLPDADDLEMADFGRLMKDLTQDAMKDAEKDHAAIFAVLDKRGRAQAAKTLNRLAVALLRTHMPFIVAGTFTGRV
uniref:RNA ligase 2 n=1 Tax=Marseillevirus LCMAC103 TaxID=2506604 RepID=A0A481YWI9_9VIRU|nr:MAG: RNA ligase 2 [Marseillevirus LCMAC103]